MKTAMIKVELCWECPHRIHDDGDGESPWEFDHCGKVNNKIRDVNSIPDWCPLPDAVEKEAPHG